MRKLTITLVTIFATTFFFSCEKFPNPYDYNCPPEIWTPAKLSASLVNRMITLSWEEKTEHFDGFILERSNDSANWEAVNKALIYKKARSYTDSANLPGSVWYYRICARADKNQSNYCYSKGVCLVPLKPDSISGVTILPQHSSEQVYSVSPVAGASSYQWTVPDGAVIISGQGTAGIVAGFGTTDGKITVMAVNSCGNSEPQMLTVLICQVPAIPGSIAGETTVPANSEDNIYSVEPVVGAESYHWKIPEGATFNYGQGTTKISVDFGSINGSISVSSVNKCGSSDYSVLPITIANSGN